ncbi:MAG: hypothetical protein VX923_00980 [Pseudomonadota bacterium]|nr:hypothetical protein [Pseudomonadota bacterium]
MSSVPSLIPFYSSVIGILAFFFMRSNSTISDTLANTQKVFAIFMIIYAFEFYIFGPFSFIGKESDSYYASAFYYLANIYNGSGFAQEFGGGQNASLLFDRILFSLGRTLFDLFPPWLAILFHKFIVGSIGFIGSFLLASRAGANKKVAAIIASIYPVSNIYLLNYSLEFETGFAAIPLAVYACINQNNNRRWLILIFISSFLFALAQPMKVFPAFLVAVVGSFILVGGNPARIFLSIALHIAASFTNWFKVLTGLSYLVGSTTRGFDYKLHVVDFFEILKESINLFFNYPTASAGILAALILARFQKKSFSNRILMALVWFVTAFIIAKGMPWQILGFGYLNKVEHAYMRLALGSIALVSLARTIAISNNFSLPFLEKKSISVKRYTNQLLIFLFSITLAFHINSKLINAAQWIVFGGQSSVFGFKNLTNPTWKPKQAYRVISIADAPHPNVIAGVYGLEAFDGSIQLNPLSWNSYWKAIKREKLELSRTATRPGLDWQHWDGFSYNLDRAIDIKLLAIANVRHIISPLPLSSALINEIVKPDKKSWVINRTEMFGDVFDFFIYGFKRIFSPGKHFVYEVSGALPRIYPASKVVIAGSECNQECFFNHIRKFASLGGVVIKKADGLIPLKTYTMKVLGAEKIKGGFSIKTYAPNGGVLVVNQSPIKGWIAEANGSFLQIIPANEIHMAVRIPPKTKAVKLLYRVNSAN